ncbi:hypothetical protein [Calidithermus roseus]|uniref:Uncharacterized protein n=1 Tax=Calidithermus roseus TaxID=1644118 RepID=A0A399EV94_9DEIN|nr:hypothetical protein [Calidithermus roseus]RIH87968.1 hypothetical protein Mrose_01035 [Calidithermus roseus]
MTRIWIFLLGLLAACNTGTPANPPLINSFAATPSSLPSGGGSVRLEWDVSGASSLSISGVGNVSPSDKGSKTLNVTASQTFTLTASNSAGSVSKDASVTVAPTPSININPTSRAFVAGDPGGSFDAIVSGSTATVNWTLEGPGSLSSSSGPSVIYTPPTSVTTMTTATLTAVLEGTGLSASATISIVPAVLTGGVLFYKGDGSGALGSLDSGGAYTPLKSYVAGELPARVTHFGKPYELYELFYSAADGSGALGSFDGAGSFRKLRGYAPGELPAGQNQMVSLSDRLVFYKATTGTTLCGSYGNDYDFSNPVTQIGYSTDWDLILRVNDANGVFFYKQPSGIGGYGTYDSSCKWTYVYSNYSFSTNWSHILRTPGGVLFYRKSDGIGALGTFAAGGSFTQTGTYISGQLAKGWEQVVNTSAGVLFYKSDGSGELGTFSGNTYTKVKAYAAGELPAGAALVAPVGK